MKKLLLVSYFLLSTSYFAFSQAPTTTNKGVTIDANGNILPATINGHVPNLPAGTTLGGVAISTGFPAFRCARVDPSGSDSTGIAGDLTKPFLTNQAAVNALDALKGVSNDNVVVLFVNGTTGGNIVSGIRHLRINGVTPNGSQVGSINYSASGIDPELILSNVTCGAVTAASDVDLTLTLESAFISGNITNTGTGFVQVLGMFGTGAMNSVTSNGGGILISGVNFATTTVNANGGNIYISKCVPIYPLEGTLETSVPITIDSSASDVWAFESLLQDVTCNALHLIDSRVVGTNSASSTAIEDILLRGDDTAYNSTSWNGNNGVATKNAIRDKFESLSYQPLSTTKVYRALLTQTGTDAPTVTVLENSLGGTVVWSYVEPGIYTGTLAAAFPSNKTFTVTGGGYALQHSLIKCRREDNNSVTVLSWDEDAPALGDEILNQTSIEILVYP